MTFEAYIVIGVLFFSLLALFKELMRPGLIFLSSSVLLMAFGIISEKELLEAFSNKAMITVALMFLVSEGIKQSGILDQIAQTYLPRARQKMRFMLPQLMIPVFFLSGFLNNIPVIIIFAPIIKKWSEKLNLSAKKFLIPLSYATIFGGMCTLIGTSTNLVVHGLIIENGYQGFSMFELGKVGIVIAFLGTIYMTFIGYNLLPGKIIYFNHARTIEDKDYYYDLTILPNSSLIGKESKNGRTKELKGLWLKSLERNKKRFEITEGTFTLQENDKILVAGKSDDLEYILNSNNVKLQGIDNIKDIPKKDLKQYEVVISPRFPGVGKTIPDFNFFDHYQAVVIAVHRNGEHITSNFKNLKLKAGDSLVLLTTKKFIDIWGESKIFYLTSYIRDYKESGTRWKKWLSLIILILMIIGSTVGRFIDTPPDMNLDMFYFAAIAATIFAYLNIFPRQNYTKYISWDLLITIACAFSLSKAMQNSGIAEYIASKAIFLSKSFGPIGVLAVVFLLTNFFTEIITNNAAAALVFPIALSAANQLGVSPKPFFVAIAIAASASFSTPIGYQTNLIVQSIGNYRFRDYLKVGLPLNILAFVVSILLIPLIWNF
ncbi:MAG: SLC13 family permease [Bacteroidales bacterium]